MHSVQETLEEFHPELFVDTITATEEDKDSAYAEIRLGQDNVKLTFKLETEVQTSVIPTQDFKKLMPQIELKRQAQAIRLWRTSAENACVQQHRDSMS